MAEVKGTACLLKVGDGNTPEAFTTLEGQTDTTFGGQVNIVDTTAKSGWQTVIVTTKRASVSVTGNLRTSRAQLDLLEAAWVSGSTRNCQIIFDAAGNGYQGAFLVSAFQVSGATDDLVTYALTLVPAGRLVTAKPSFLMLIGGGYLLLTDGASRLERTR